MAKHSNTKNTKLNKIIRTAILILLVIITLVLLVISLLRDVNSLKNISQNTNVTSNYTTTDEDNMNAIQENIELDFEKVPDKIEKYNVLGTIAIDKIGVVKNILDQTTDESLNLAVTKFYGPNLNEKGNFCITGHNYRGTFKNLDDLEINDTFYIIDKKNSEKVTYKIYDKYTVNPTELECLNQETNGKREVTIITCNPGGLTRLIVKAKEI